jgi:hypothetical protein
MPKIRKNILFKSITIFWGHKNLTPNKVNRKKEENRTGGVCASFEEVQVDATPRYRIFNILLLDKYIILYPTTPSACAFGLISL